MTAKDMILPEIPCLTPETTVSQGLEAMCRKHRLSLPVVEEGIYAGVIHAEELLQESGDVPIGRENLRSSRVREESHLLEVFNQFAQYRDDVLAVVDKEHRYCGAVPIHTAVVAMARLCHTASPGAIIELEIVDEDYSATELSRLVEDNGCRVINLLARPDATTGLWRVCLRIDRGDATSVLRSLERFNYRVVSCHRVRGIMDDRMEQRFKELMYYLEI